MRDGLRTSREEVSEGEGKALEVVLHTQEEGNPEELSVGWSAKETSPKEEETMRDEDLPSKIGVSTHREENTGPGMQQKVGIVHQHGGNKTAVQMEQTFRALGKKELLSLSEIHEGYLLEELRERGYKLDDEHPIIKRMTVHTLAETIFELIRTREDIGIHDVLDEFFNYAFRRCRDDNIYHKDLAKWMGVSTRVVCHHHRSYKEGKPVKRILEKVKREKGS